MYNQGVDERQEVRRNLHSLLCSHSISTNTFNNVEAILGQEWGPFQGTVYESQAAPGMTCAHRHYTEGHRHQPGMLSTLW